MKNSIKSQRQLRVGQQLKHIISEVITLGDFQNEKIRVSVQRYQVTVDYLLLYFM